MPDSEHEPGRIGNAERGGSAGARLRGRGCVSVCRMKLQEIGLHPEFEHKHSFLNHDINSVPGFRRVFDQMTGALDEDLSQGIIQAGRRRLFEEPPSIAKPP
jgi:hypothetical protein